MPLPRLAILGSCLVAACALLLASSPASAADAKASRIQTIHTSLASPPIPDPSGLALLPGSGRLLVSDSEVNEIPSLFVGFNLFEITRTGTVIATRSTLAFSDEPTGVARDPQSGTCFVSDDTDDRAIHVVDPGADAACGTPDDAVHSLPSADFGSQDPEDVAYCGGALLIADGAGTVVRLTPGSNGVFDGAPPSGDDAFTSFATAGLGLTDLQGIECDADGHLYLVGNPQNLVFHLTPSGELVRTIDISAATPLEPSALAFAPGSADPTATHLYVADRGVDNNADPTENDGRITELALPPRPFLLELAVVGNGNVVQQPSGRWIDAGTLVALDAQPDPGFGFAGWSGDLTGRTDPALLLMDADKQVSARFIDLPDCRDGIDNDGDGLVDYPEDPGCASRRFEIENPSCDDGVDNDGDGRVDHPADAQCSARSDWTESCGLGFELALLLPPLAWLYRRRARSRRSLPSR